MAGNFSLKRRFPRRLFRQPVGILIDGAYQIGQGDQVGEGGLSLFGDFKLPAGKNILITFALEDELHVMRGEIRSLVAVNARKNEVGIAFQNVTFKFKKLIRRYIGARSEEELELEQLERIAAGRPTK